MNQQEKANEVLNWVFLQPRHARVGVSEKFLCALATKRWVGENEKLNADILICEANIRADAGKLKRFNRGQTAFFKLP